MEVMERCKRSQALLAVIVVAVCIVLLAGCTENSHASQKNANSETGPGLDAAPGQTQSVSEADPQIRILKEKYPEYFELGTFKGLEVYAWQMAEDYYRFGLMQGTNRQKTLEELRASP